MKIKICHRKVINIRVKVNETKITMITKTDIVLREEKNMYLAILRQRENMEINIKLLMK